MSSTPQLPEDLYEARDAVIENVHKGIEPPESLELIHEWLEDDGWDALVGSITNETMAVNVHHLGDHCFNDAEFIAGWLGEKQPITDSMRVEHIRMLLQQAINNGDGWEIPSIYSFPIAREDGKSAVISCAMETKGQGGPETSWWGIYKTHKDFLAALKKAGVIPIEYIDDLTDAELLTYWQNTLT
jgi:hypothetical protein